ncbi:hypothetical protein ABZ569_34080 [Streptomyces albus]|uniref:hypothetical protein n=1 Tax=Streptomyces albus TaxID=1888 RepID=UPI0033F7A293
MKWTPERLAKLASYAAMFAIIWHIGFMLHVHPTVWPAMVAMCVSFVLWTVAEVRRKDHDR